MTGRKNSDHYLDLWHPNPGDVHSFSAPTWDSVSHAASSGNRIRSARARLDRLGMLGTALESGGDVPAEALRWLGYALVEIANGVSPERALDLRAPKGRQPAESNHYWRAAEMLFLVEAGLTQNAAAELLAKFNDREEIAPFIKSHNDMRKRRRVFRDLRNARLHHISWNNGAPTIKTGLPGLDQLTDCIVAVDFNFPGESRGIHIHEKLLEALLHIS